MTYENCIFTDFTGDFVVGFYVVSTIDSKFVNNTLSGFDVYNAYFGFIGNSMETCIVTKNVYKRLSRFEELEEAGVTRHYIAGASYFRFRQYLEYQYFQVHNTAHLLLDMGICSKYYANSMPEQKSL